MTESTTIKDSLLFKQKILGSSRLSNYFWAIVVAIGGSGFLLASISSYLKVNLIPFSDTSDLIFMPQGLVMGFYGVMGIILDLYLWFVIILDVGGGYNEFDKQTGYVKIFRWGYPGKDRQIEVKCQIKDVQAVQIEIKEGLNPKRSLYLRIKGKRDIPLTRVGQPISLKELENQGAELARFLGVPLEGL